MSYVWINGQLVDKSEAKISVFDHGFLYGDGVWEHFRAFNGKLFRPERAFFYLGLSASMHSMELPLSLSETIIAIDSTLQANNRNDGYVRVIVTRGTGTLGPDPRKLHPQAIIIAEEYQPFPAAIYEHGLDVVVAPAAYCLHGLESLNRQIGRSQIVSAKRHALWNGCLDAILWIKDNAVLGSTEGSLFLVVDGEIKCLLHWPSDVVWECVFDLAKSEGLSCVSFREGPGQPEPKTNMMPLELFTATVVELVAANEVFLAGTSCGIIGIVQVDGQPIGTGTEGPVTKRIREAYRKLTRREA